MLDVRSARSDTIAFPIACVDNLFCVSSPVCARGLRPPRVTYYRPVLDIGGGGFTAGTFDQPRLQVINKPAKYTPMSIQLPLAEVTPSKHGKPAIAVTPFIFQPAQYTPGSTEFRYYRGEIVAPRLDLPIFNVRQQKVVRNGK